MYRPSILETISLAKSNGVTVPPPPAAVIPAVKAVAPAIIAGFFNKPLPAATAVALHGAVVEPVAAQSSAPLNADRVLEPMVPGKE